MSYLTYGAGDSVADRYTVFPFRRRRGTERNWYLALSAYPGDPQGFSQWGQAAPRPHMGRRIRFADLPARVQDHVRNRLTEE